MLFSGSRRNTPAVDDTIPSAGYAGAFHFAAVH